MECIRTRNHSCPPLYCDTDRLDQGSCSISKSNQFNISCRSCSTSAVLSMCLLAIFTKARSILFRGIFIAIQRPTCRDPAAGLLKKMFPRLQLLIAGAHQRHGIRKDGYITWIESLTRQLDLSQNVAWLGSLDASQMCKELNSASAMILPSFVENCKRFMQEAMMVGTPVVASYAGDCPRLLWRKNRRCLPPGDAAMCAWQIQRLLTDRDLANRFRAVLGRLHSIAMIAQDCCQPNKNL